MGRLAPAPVSYLLLTWGLTFFGLFSTSHYSGLSTQSFHPWGRSSVGRALEWHSRGRGFDSHRLHHPWLWKPPELRVASHFLFATICPDTMLSRVKGVPRSLLLSPRLRRIFPEVLTKGNWRRGTIMKYVYLLQSLSVPSQRYVGVTTNLNERLQVHNVGAFSHTSKYRPWNVVTAIALLCL
jgi:GIY-YIG catalytic domain